MHNTGNISGVESFNFGISSSTGFPYPAGINAFLQTVIRKLSRCSIMGYIFLFLLILASIKTAQTKVQEHTEFTFYALQWCALRLAVLY